MSEEFCLSDFIEYEKIKVEYYKGEEILEDEEDISFVNTDKINWAVKKLKEENHNLVKKYIKGNMDEQIFLEGSMKEIIDKIFGPKLSGDKLAGDKLNGN